MTLPWFAFRIEKYLSDTMTLDTEGHGAYLLLMLHYYGTGKPPRDNDRTLAAICRLPMNRWLDRRPDIEAFFQPRDGFWHHAFIEAELLEAGSKHARSKAKAEAASAAMHAKLGHKPTPSQPQAKPKHSSKPKSAPSTTPSTASSQLEAQPEHSLDDAHLHKHTTYNSSSSDDDPTKAALQVQEGIGSAIDPSFRPEADRIERCKADGATEAEVEQEIELFIAYNCDHATFSADWDSTWVRWWARWRARQSKEPKAPPRIEVNTTPDWDAHAKMWVTIGRWPSHGAGGEPGMQSCRCPADVLLRHSIDPKSGLKIIKERA